MSFFKKRDKSIAKAKRENQIILAYMLLGLFGDWLPTHIYLVQYFSNLRQHHLLQIFQLLREHVFDLHSMVLYDLLMGH